MKHGDLATRGPTCANVRCRRGTSRLTWAATIGATGLTTIRARRTTFREGVAFRGGPCVATRHAVNDTAIDVRHSLDDQQTVSLAQTASRRDSVDPMHLTGTPTW